MMNSCMKNNDKIIRSFGIARPYNKVYLIKTNDERIETTLNRIFGPYICNDVLLPGKPIEVEYDGNGFKVMVDNVVIRTEKPIEFIMNYMYEDTSISNGITAFHGAAIEYQDSAILFLGRTGAGKTTLTYYLVANGYKYVTDDCILIDNKTMRVIPYSMPLHLRAGGVEVLKNLGVNVSNLEECQYSEQEERFVECVESTDKHNLPIEHIFFIERNPYGSLISDISIFDRIKKTISSLFVPCTIDHELLAVISGISLCNCHILNCSDLQSVLRCLNVKGEK